MQIMKCFDTTWLTKSSPASANAALSPHPRLQTSYPPSAHSISPSSASLPPSLAPGRPSTPPAPSPPSAAKSCIFLAASNALLNPGGLLRWNKRLVKDARLLLPLTEMMKIARLPSPLLDAPLQSPPRPRLRHDRRLALLSHLSLTLNLYTLFFVQLHPGEVSTTTRPRLVFTSNAYEVFRKFQRN